MFTNIGSRAGRKRPLAATAIAPGVVKLATAAEAITGTDTARAVTPAGVLAALQGQQFFELAEVSTPATPAANKLRVYAKDVSGVTNFFMVDSAGTESQFGVGYAEGTFTPTITFATPGDLSVSYSRQLGAYTRVGRVVYYWIDLAFTPTFTTSSGNFVINGLPFTSAAFGTGFACSLGSQSTINYGSSDLQLNARVNDADTTITLLFALDNAAGVVAATGNFVSGTGKSFLLSGSYYV